jgi:hypothetical protein
MHSIGLRCLLFAESFVSVSYGWGLKVYEPVGHQKTGDGLLWVNDDVLVSPL